MSEQKQAQSEDSGLAKRVLMAKAGKREVAMAPLDARAVWIVLAAVGGALALVGLIDLVLLWYPLAFGNPEWEYVTISGHFDALPLATIGLLAFSLGSLGLNLRWAARATAMAWLAMALMNLGIFVIYLLVFPVALSGVAPALKPTLKEMMLKTGLYFLIYTVLYASVGAFVWRRTRLVEPGAELG